MQKRCYRKANGTKCKKCHEKRLLRLMKGDEKERGKKGDVSRGERGRENQMRGRGKGN